MVLPGSREVSRVSRYSGVLIRSSGHFTYRAITVFGGPFQVLWLCFKFLTSHFRCNESTENPTTPDIQRLQAISYIRFGLGPCSLAATEGIAFAFFSWGYLDVSVPPVSSLSGTRVLIRVGFPIQTSSDRSLFGSSPRLIAAFHVFLRLPTPRHSPCALFSLTVFNKYGQAKKGTR